MTSSEPTSEQGPVGLSHSDQGQVSPLTPRQQKALTTRRRFLQATVGGSLAAIAAAFAFPVLAIRSITQYQDVIAQGDVVSDPSGRAPLDIASFPVNSSAYAYPVGKPTTTQLNKVELVRVAENGDADDFRAYSQVCTHVGCSVEPALSPEGTIICPCHFSQFDINSGKVVHGPAQKTLPHIALAMDEQGQLIFDSDEYSAPIGPGA